MAFLRGPGRRGRSSGAEASGAGRRGGEGREEEGGKAGRPVGAPGEAWARAVGSVGRLVFQQSLA